jgi:indolepyruvate ferredoxin oxidoreductase
VGEYRALVARAVERLDAGSVGVVTEIAELPDLVRGYEQIKLAGVERMRARAGELSARLESRRPLPVVEPGRNA